MTIELTYDYQSGKFNQLSSTATATYGFDENGNTRTKSEGSNFWSYNWDYENRMVEASTRKQKVRYKYDALGRRVQRFRPGWEENTKYTHDGLDVLVDNDNGTLTKYLNRPGIDNKLRTQTGSSVNYFLTDHLGSTNGLTDSVGSLTSSASYDSFGNQTGNLATRYGFTGRERDDFSGQMYYRARFYDPKLGRFTSEDPIGFGGGINLYGYVKNNPYYYRDPMGHNPCVASWAAAGAIGGAVFGGGVGLVGVVGGGVAVVVTEPAGLALGAAGGGALGAGVGTLVCPGTPPFPDQSDIWSKPSPTSQPYCKPMPKSVPFPEAIPFPRVIPVPTPGRRNCAEEIQACSQQCADRQGDPDFRNGFGGSLEQCMKNCLSEECGGEPKWKGYKSKPGPKIWKF